MTAHEIVLQRRDDAASDMDLDVWFAGRLECSDDLDDFADLWFYLPMPQWEARGRPQTMTARVEIPEASDG